MKNQLSGKITRLIEKIQALDLGKRHYTGLALLVALGISGAFLTGSGGSADNLCDTDLESLNQDVKDWRNYTLVNVESCEKFRISELDKPVLVETFAVWCPTCTRQQQELKRLHEKSDVTSVSLDVDRNEDIRKIRRHRQRNGFDWRYAVSPLELTRMMVKRYDTSIANPPSAPMILVCENGTRKLPNGVKPVSKLQEEIKKGC
ncbi:MAG: TlpA family protein disulfide reductase [Candidatus Nanohaloarchaea archaeon]